MRTIAALIAFGFVACAAQRNLERVENVHGYGDDIDECFKRSANLDEYHACANAADVKHGRVGGKDAGQ